MVPVLFVLIGLHDERLTITIDVDGTRITLAVVISVGLCWITVVWTIIASVTNLIMVVVILSWVKDERAIVLIQNKNIQPSQWWNQKDRKHLEKLFTSPIEISKYTHTS